MRQGEAQVLQSISVLSAEEQSRTTRIWNFVSVPSVTVITNIASTICLPMSM